VSDPGSMRRLHLSGAQTKRLCSTLSMQSAMPEVLHASPAHDHSKLTPLCFSSGLRCGQMSRRQLFHGNAEDVMSWSFSSRNPCSQHPKRSTVPMWRLSRLRSGLQ
jgi:hypothetical protein